MLYSVIIPCYKSDQTIEHVVRETREEMVRLGKADVEFILSMTVPRTEEKPLKY